MMMFAQFILGAAMFFLSGVTRNIDEQEIKKVVEQFVYSRLDTSKEKCSIEYRSVPSKVLNVPKDATLCVVVDQHTELRNGIMLSVEVSSREHVEHTFLVSLRIRRYARVLVASAKVEKREAGNLIAVNDEMMETTTLPSDVVTNREAIKDKRAKRMIKQGAVLMESMFERVPIVNQGSAVTLLVKANGIVIKTQAIVRQDGATGDIVAVQKMGSGEKLKARVIDEHTVEMSVQE